MVTDVPSKILLRFDGVEVKLPPAHGVTETSWKQEHDPEKVTSSETVNVIELCS